MASLSRKRSRESSDEEDNVPPNKKEKLKDVTADVESSEKAKNDEQSKNEVDPIDVGHHDIATLSWIKFAN